MSGELVCDGVRAGPLFTVYAAPPWLLHLEGELDLDGAPALIGALEGPIRRGGVIGLDLARLTFMDSTGTKARLGAVNGVRGRGRVVVFHPTPAMRRLIDLCGMAGVIDISDDLSSAHPNGLNGDQADHRRS